MATLTGISEDVKGRHIELDIDTVTIGRVDDNTVTIDNPTVSSHHAHIARSDDGFILKDLGSTNGTRLNAREVQEVQLNPKDVVQVGSIEFVFDDEEDPRGPRHQTVSTTRVTEESGGGVKPESFDSISPFGSAKKESKSIWFGLISLIGLLALAVVIYYFMKLISAS